MQTSYKNVFTMILKTMTMQQRSNQTKLETDNYEWSRPDQLCIVS